MLLSLDETAILSRFTGDHDISDKYFFDRVSEYSFCKERKETFCLFKWKNIWKKWGENWEKIGKQIEQKNVHTVFSWLFKRISSEPLANPIAMYFSLTLTEEIDTGNVMNS